MKSFSVNWKTTVAGAAVIALAFVDSAVFDIPGFSIGMSEAVAIGLGLIFAKDGDVTGGTVRQ